MSPTENAIPRDCGYTDNCPLWKAFIKNDKQPLGANVVLIAFNCQLPEDQTWSLDKCPIEFIKQ